MNRRDGMNIFFIVDLALLQIFVTFLSFVIYEFLGAAFGIVGPAPFILLIVLSFTFILASVLAAKYENKLVCWFHFFSMCWLALIGPLFFGCAAFFIIENTALIFGLHIVSSVTGWISFLGATFLYLYGIRNASVTKVTRVVVKIPNLPEWWHGRRIAFMIDVHFGNGYGVGFAEKTVRKLSSLAPEAVFIGGDLFDGVKCDPDEIIAPFKKLQVSHGIYFASGNHEYYGDSELFFSAIKHAGIVILKNEGKTIEGMNFFGVDFKDTSEKNNFEKIIAEMKLDQSKANVLVKHVPDNLEIAEQAGVSLELSGHTHHGQIFPFSYFTRKIFKGYDYGLKQLGKMAVYTSSGVGAAVVPFRIGTQSEIALITFE